MTEQVKAPVMADVAKLAGVSHQTVSRVINGFENIRPSTRKRVEQAIRTLGYRPNRAARNLVTRRSRTIGVISTYTGYFGPNSIRQSVEQEARAQGYFAGSVSLPRVDARSLGEAIEHLLSQSVEGLVIIAGQAETLELIREIDPGVPYVVAEGNYSDAMAAVAVDQVAGAQAATEHLIELGHTRVAHIRGMADWTEAEARESGWRTSLTEHGLDSDLLFHGDWSARSGYEAGRQIAADPTITAAFVGNDHMAVGLLRALYEAGRTVPRDFSVVGFDDIPEAGYLVPPLTTVRQNFAEIGRRAIAYLDAEIGDHPMRLSPLPAPEIILRRSTAHCHA